jgi:hypothetical protein
LDSLVAYSQWWLERRGVRRWPAARQWQHRRRGSGSGKMPAMLGIKCDWTLTCGLGKTLGSRVGHGRKRECEFAGGASGGR